MYTLEELNVHLLSELKEIAEKLEVTNFKKLPKKELIYKILDKQAITPEKDLPAKPKAKVEQKVESGQIHDYAHAANILGITRTRMAQVLKLLFLAPRIQEALLAGNLDISERQLRPVLRHALWEEQEALVGIGE